ncbi:MAG: CocE/NonD family hydrolase [Crocinitomicaceae bacterium]|nr:CocE/NonD family hydrolase [Crocinitomicaceae bacterium]
MKTLILILMSFFVLGKLRAQKLSSYYVPMEDGVKLAVDVYLPKDYKGGKLPVLIQFERYWRASVTKKEPVPQLHGRDKYFNDNGYIIVIVDTRGTGASFGTRISEYSPVQVMDASVVLDWVVSQSWSDGKVGSYGTSYTGTTAELLCATNHPSIKAVIPGWSDFDVYRSPVRPYGMMASSFVRKWSIYVRLLDRNNSLILRSSIHPVDEDSLKAAISEHKKNPNVYDLVSNNHFRNSGNGVFDYEDCSVVHWKKEIEQSKVPMLILASWMDAGTAEGAITRLEHFNNPQKVLLMATSHGGWSHASPFRGNDTLYFPNPRISEQNQLQLDFFDHYIKGIDKGVEDWPLIKYYNLGEEKYKESNEWPVPNATVVNYYFQEEGGLSKVKPKEVEGSDTYKVDFGVYTSKKNRWTTQMGGPVIGLHHRNEMDERMLVYTSQPVEEEVQITGTPTVSLKLSSTHTDGGVFVYLEDVAPDGSSTYITEGGLRLIHRKEALQTNEQFNMHTFNEEDSALMKPGNVELVAFKLWPISVLVKKGHSIRVAIAGADKSVFDRLPKRGTPKLTIHHGKTEFSFITLPIVQP